MNNENLALHDRVVLVTGAAGGIGRAITDVLSGAGAQVVATDLLSASSGAEQDDLVHLDVTSATEVAKVVQEIVERFGRLDGLVNNAGIVRFSPLSRIAEHEWNEVFDVNVKGAFLCCREFARHVDARGGTGKIVNVSSSAGRIGYANQSHYCASKAAMLGLTKALAVELAPKGVTVNAVCPGPVDTPMLDQAVREQSVLHGMELEAYEKRVLSSIPLGRKAQPKDVALAVAYLASPASDNITGQTLGIDGGIVRV